MLPSPAITPASSPAPIARKLLRKSESCSYSGTARHTVIGVKKKLMCEALALNFSYGILKTKSTQTVSTVPIRSGLKIASLKRFFR